MRDPYLGKNIADRFRITEKLPSGGMSTLYKAEDTRGGQVVLKFCPDRASRQRFRDEIVILRSVQHPNIQDFLGSGTYNTSPYYVMPFYQHRNFRQYLDDRNQMMESSLLDHFQQICQAVSYLHDKRILHNDLKPQNFLITQEQRLILVDFGLSEKLSHRKNRMHSEKIVFGSPVYLAPEVGTGEAASFSSDIYALGVILYILYLGFPPFYHAKMETLLSMHRNIQPTPPRDLSRFVSAHINKIILRALSKDPRDRYENASILLKEIQKYGISMKEKRVKMIERRPGALSFDQEDTKTVII